MCPVTGVKRHKKDMSFRRFFKKKTKFSNPKITKNEKNQKFFFFFQNAQKKVKNGLETHFGGSADVLGSKKFFSLLATF